MAYEVFRIGNSAASQSGGVFVLIMKRFLKFCLFGLRALAAVSLLPDRAAPSRALSGSALFLFLFVAADLGRAQVLLQENFSFTGALTSNGWNALNLPGTNPINATSPGLTYPNFPSSGLGNAVSISTTGEDDRKVLAVANSSGAIYSSFLINVSAAQADGDYFYALSSGASGYIGRVFARSSGAGFQLGISKFSGGLNVTYDPAVLNFGTTYLIVTKIDRLGATNNDDVASLWINPPLGASEAAANVTNSSGNDQNIIDSIVLRQGSLTAAPTLRLGNILVGTTWGSVTPAATSLFIKGYPHQTAIANTAFTGVRPEISGGSSSVIWSLPVAPSGMLIDAQTGIITWNQPVKGSYRVHLRASAGGQTDTLVWNLLVVDQYAGQRMVSTKYVDFVVPEEIAAWMETWQPHELVDRAWEYMCAVIGQQPYHGRQAIILNPSMGGGAVSGNPVQLGPGWWKNDAIEGWYFFSDICVHEQAHNFNHLVRMPEGGDWPNFDPYVHHMCEFVQQSFIAAVLADPASYGLSGPRLTNYLAFAQRLKGTYTNRSANFFSHINAGGNALNYTGDKYGAWQKILDILATSFGQQILRDTLLAYRPDGLSQNLRKTADSETKRITMLVAVMSAIAKQDLRPNFSSWGWTLDNSYYDSIWSQVVSTISGLPLVGYTPWRYSSVSGKSYALTDLALNWTEAQMMARRVGGNLMTISRAEDMEFLKQVFGPRPYLLGGSDASQEGQWTWSSGLPFSYTAWMPGEPNGSTRENYLVSNWWNADGWIDGDINGVFQGIIEVQEPAFRPSLKWMGFTHNGRPLLEINAPASASATIETTTNFITWSAVANFRIPGSVSSWSDTNSANATVPQRFYRLRIAP